MYLIKIPLFILISFLYFFPLNASVLDEINERGYLICGISEPRIGFANIDAESNWAGFDVDICKAIAAAIFSDTDKVEYILTTTKSRFPMLAGREIDVLSRMTTWTYSRDVNLSFEFTGINFFDGQGFMIRSSLEIESAKELDGAKICIVEGTSSKFNIDNFFNNNNIKYIPIPVEYDDEAFENFLVDRCDVYSNTITELANKRILLSNSSDFIILPELISKEPLGTVVNHGDDQWRDVVSWSLNIMILAEELNINSKNIDNYANSENNEILRMLGIIGAYGDMIELNEKWAYNIIKLVGNYKEVFDRNLGQNTLLNLDRGLNNLYLNGGLLYSPPFK